jgi:hypothetical protein
VNSLQPTQDGQTWPTAERSFPGADCLSRIAGRHLSIAERDRGGNEIPSQTERVLEVQDGRLGSPPLEFGFAHLVVEAGQPFGFAWPVRRRCRGKEALLSADRLLRTLGREGGLTQPAEGRLISGSPPEDSPVEVDGIAMSTLLASRLRRVKPLVRLPRIGVGETRRSEQAAQVTAERGDAAEERRRYHDKGQVRAKRRTTGREAQLAANRASSSTSR